jgi:hypothetical protein
VFIDIINTSLAVLPTSHDALAQFTKGLTVSNLQTFQLIGHARAVSGLSIGTVVLDPIKFNVSSGLTGLNSLNTQPTVIESVDVLGGTTVHISLGIAVQLFNPSNLNLQAGDVYLELFSQKQPIGTTLLPNLNLVRGLNTLNVSGNFTPNVNAQGRATLDNFVNGKNTSLVISGYPNSTDILSLLPAFEALTINATLPGLNTSLLEYTSLEVLPTTGHVNNITNATVALHNPFTASLAITYINASVSAFGIPLGSIETNTTFEPRGKSVTVSPGLPLNLNLDPPSVFTVLRALAVEAGLPTVQLDSIVALGGYSYLPITNDSSLAGGETVVQRRDALEWESAGVDELMMIGKRANIYSCVVAPFLSPILGHSLCFF